MADETANNIGVENSAEAQSAENAANTTESSAAKEPNVETIPKALFDKKVSELTRQLKELKNANNAKMSESEKAAAEREELLAELKEAKDTAARMKAAAEFSAVGVNAETAEALSEAAISGDTETIISAMKVALKAAKDEATAAAKKALLDAGTAKIPIGGDKGGEKPKSKYMEFAEQYAKSKNPEKKSNPWL